MPTGPDIGDYASVASAVFAAVATGAAWMSASQARRAAEASERPQLEIQVLADPETGMLGASVVNTGRGVARGSTVLLHALGRYVQFPIGDGFVQPGEKVHLKTDIGPAPIDRMKGDLPDMAALVGYRDNDGFVHYRSNKGGHYVPKTLVRRRPSFPDRTDAFRHLYPNIELARATPARGYLAKPE